MEMDDSLFINRSLTKESLFPKGRRGGTSGTFVLVHLLRFLLDVPSGGLN